MLSQRSNRSVRFSDRPESSGASILADLDEIRSEMGLPDALDDEPSLSHLGGNGNGNGDLGDHHGPPPPEPTSPALGPRASSILSDVGSFEAPAEYPGGLGSPLSVGEEVEIPDADEDVWAALSAEIPKLPIDPSGTKWETVSEMLERSKPFFSKRPYIPEGYSSDEEKEALPYEGNPDQELELERDLLKAVRNYKYNVANVTPSQRYPEVIKDARGRVVHRSDGFPEHATLSGAMGESSFAMAAGNLKRLDVNQSKEMLYHVLGESASEFAKPPKMVDGMMVEERDDDEGTHTTSRATAAGHTKLPPVKKEKKGKSTLFTGSVADVDDMLGVGEGSSPKDKSDMTSHVERVDGGSGSTKKKSSTLHGSGGGGGVFLPAGPRSVSHHTTVSVTVSLEEKAQRLERITYPKKASTTLPWNKGQVEGLRRMWLDVDADGDGIINLEDVESYMEAVALRNTRSDSLALGLSSLLAKANIKPDGEMRFREFVKLAHASGMFGVGRLLTRDLTAVVEYCFPNLGRPDLMTEEHHNVVDMLWNLWRPRPTAVKITYEDIAATQKNVVPRALRLLWKRLDPEGYGSVTKSMLEHWFAETYVKEPADYRADASGRKPLLDEKGNLVSQIEYQNKYYLKEEKERAR